MIHLVVRPHYGYRRPVFYRRPMVYMRPAMIYRHPIYRHYGYPRIAIRPWANPYGPFPIMPVGMPLPAVTPLPDPLLGMGLLSPYC